MHQKGKSIILKDIEMGPMAFERESSVPLLFSIVQILRDDARHSERGHTVGGVGHLKPVL